MGSRAAKESSEIKGFKEEFITPQEIDVGLKYKTEVISSEKAGDLIRAAYRAPEALRPARLDLSAVNYYSEVMEKGGWLLNGVPIIFDPKGHLLDGLHRLEAARRTGKPLRTLVAHGAKADTLHTIDQQRRRTFIGILEARGVAHAGDVHRSLTKLIRIHNGLLIRNDISPNWARLDIVLDGNPELIEASLIAAEFSSDCGIPNKTRTPLTFMALKAGKKEQFLKFISDMTDPSVGASNPARMLQFNIDSILENTRINSVDPDVALGMAIKSFNDYTAGKTATGIYSWQPNYGEGVSLKADGKPVSQKAVREAAPPNCGLPEMDGYPGLKNGTLEANARDENLFTGATAEIMKQAALENDGEPRVITVLVYPELAKYWLDNFNRVNRKIQKAHIDQITRDIKEGHWMVNAQPISFAGNPFSTDFENIRLLNGQHRLHACMKAETPIEVPIAINVDPNTFPTFDIHAKRQKTIKAGDDRVARAAAVLQWRQDHGLPVRHRDRPTATEIGLTLKRHPGLVEHVSRVRRKEGMGRADQIATGGIMAYFLYRIHCENPPLAEEFALGMRSGADLQNDNPILTMRDKATKQRHTAQQMTRYESLEFLLYHWEKYKTWRKKNAPAEQLAMGFVEKAYESH